MKPSLALPYALLLCSALSLTACTSAPPATAVADQPNALLSDPAVTRGRLDNGLSYYLRRNGYPSQQVKLQLVVKAGSLMETDSERGLAHFVEHMAFNGTRHYPKNALVSELESMGMQFGSHLNAFTSYRETVYQLTVPTDRPENLGKALTILRDWADGMSFPEEEVLKERGVVLEEWRARKGVSERLQDQILPELYAGSRYLTRKPIGEPDIIRGATAAQLRGFYRNWYQPTRMAVVAVGDVEPAQLQAELSRRFGSLRAQAEPAEPDMSVRFPPGQRHASALDPETPVTSAELAYVHTEPRLATSADYRQLLTRELALAVLNERLEDQMQSAGTPLLHAGISVSPLDPQHSLYTLAARTTGPRLLDSFAALQKELTRITALGVTRDELERQKADYLAGLEQALLDQQRIASDVYVEAYTSHYLSGDPYLSVAEERRQSALALPRITPEDVRANLAALFGPDRLVVVSGPSHPAQAYPVAPRIAATLAQAAAAAPQALAEVDARAPLLPQRPAPGRLLTERQLPELGVTELVYANGVRVLLKPTDFQNTEILMQAWSPGGLSRVAQSDFRNAVVSTDLVAESGYGPYSFSELKKATAGQLLSLSPYLDGYEEGLSGSSQPQDLETLLQLAHLAFTAPRLDGTVFQALRGRLRDYTAHRQANSAQRFDDAVTAKYTQDDPRYQPWTSAMVEALDPARALQLYRERFAAAGDFEFVFAGAFSVAGIKPLLATYLGSLPDNGRREAPADPGRRTLTGQHRLELAEASEPRTQVRLLLSGPARWNREELYLFNSLKQVLDSRLRQEIRENLAGVYDISLGAELSPWPTPRFESQIAFVCAPERAEELVAAVRRILGELKQGEVRQAEIDTVLAAQRQEYLARQRDNGAWVQALKFYRQAGWDPRGIFLRDFPSLSRGLTSDALRNTAQRYLGQENLLVAQLRPAVLATAIGPSPATAK